MYSTLALEKEREIVNKETALNKCRYMYSNTPIIFLHMYLGRVSFGGGGGGEGLKVSMLPLVNFVGSQKRPQMPPYYNA